MKQIVALVMVFFLSFSCNFSKFFNKKDKKENYHLNIPFKKEGELSINDIKFDIEIADDEYQTSTGLMYRDSIKDTQAMLFIFENEQVRSFYMKNTRIYLDIIFINSKKEIIHIHENAKPYDESSIYSNGIAKYVLEINGGLAKKLGIKLGDKIEF